MNMEQVGRRIRAIRRKRGLTQVELAKRLNMTPKYISNIECGAKTPKLETFIALANALEIDANALLTDVLKVFDEVQCSQLWEHLEKLPEEKRQRALRMLELMVQEL